MINFRCPECNILHALEDELAGLKAKCENCNNQFIIPNSSTTEDAGEKKQLSIEKRCSFCSMDIEDDEGIVICPSCGMMFHEDCWEENFGCATYGCDQVDILKPPPPIITNDDFQNIPNVPPPLHSETMMQWEFPILACSLISALLGLFTYGLFCVPAGIGGILYWTISKRKKNTAVMVISTVICGIGFIIGLIVSWNIY